MSRWYNAAKFAWMTISTALASAVDILVHGYRLWTGIIKPDLISQGVGVTPDPTTFDFDEMAVNAITGMEPEELAGALNQAMFMVPDDPDSLYPDWFVELAREGLYMAGAATLRGHVAGTCVVRFNDKHLGFDPVLGGWHPVNMV